MPDSANIDSNFGRGLIVGASTNVRSDGPVALWADKTTHRLLVDAGSITTSSATAGTTGAAVPASADYIGVNSGGNLVGLALGQATMANSLPVVLASNQTSIPVTLATLPALIAGSAIIGKVTTDQTTHGTTDLVAADITKVGGSTVTLGQSTMANSIPVAIASNQGNVPVTLGDGTNTANILKSDGTAAGQNAQITAGSGMTTATVNLSAGTQSTVWYDLLNYAWVSIEILTNTTPATLTFQTSGDAAQTNVRAMPLMDSQNVSGSPVTNTTSATGTFHGPRTGRYFRISSNLAGGNTATLVLTFFTNGSGSLVNNIAPLPTGTNSIGNVGAKDATGAAVPANAFYMGVNPQTALPAAATAGNLVGATGDKFGRQAVILDGPREIKLNSPLLTLTSTTETSLIAAVAATFNDITGVVANNTSATAVRVDFRDSSTGTIQFCLYIPAGDVRGFSNLFYKQTTVNTAWTAQLSGAVTDVRISATYTQYK